MFSNYSDGLSSLVYQITYSLKIKAYSFRIGTDDFPDAINAFGYNSTQELLSEQTQLVDILPPEDVDEFYSDTEEVNTTTAAEEEWSSAKGLKPVRK